MDQSLKMPDGIALSQNCWNALPEEAKAVIFTLAQLVPIVASLRERVAELEAKLNANSSNSSKPPSSDPPSMPQRKSPPSLRPRGAQPGHPGASRMMVSLPDLVVNEAPEACRACGTGLADQPLCGTPERRQVTDLPVIAPIVTEHRLFERQCPHCAKRTRAHGPQSAFGPRVHAFVSLLAGRFHLSHRDIRNYLNEHLHLNLGLGSIAAIERRASAALSHAADEAWEDVKHAPVRYLDETSWRVKNAASWLWVARSETATAFALEPSRGKDVLRRRFGDALDDGYIVTDRYRAYTIVDMDRRGICHAHIKRDFTKMAELAHEDGKMIGRLCLAGQREVFELAGRLRAETISRERFLADSRCELAVMRKVLEYGTRVPGTTAAARTIRGMCGDLLAHWRAMWTWLSVPGVSATNNAAERALRPAVLKRKMSYGNQSVAGSRFIECILTVVQTCLQRGRSVEAFLADTMHAAMGGRPVPALLTP